MNNFQRYLQESLSGLSPNQILMGALFATIITILRGYFDKWKEDYYYLNKTKTGGKIFIEILFLICIIPASILVLIFMISIFWLISLLN